MLPVVILDGGYGSRLLPLTLGTPKALIPVNGKPFLFHQLTRLYQQGIQQVIICTGYLGDQIEAYASTLSLDMSITVINEGATPIGTAASIRRVLPLLGNHFFVLYGDCYLTCNFAQIQAAYQNKSLPAMMVIYQKINGNVHFDSGLAHYDKTTNTHRFNDYGLSIVSADVLHQSEEPDIADVYKQLDPRLGGYLWLSPPYEIGSFTGLRNTEQFLRHALV